LSHHESLVKRFMSNKKHDLSRQERVTIKEVARTAGVAVGTVSRVVNNYPDVNPELREHVLRIAAQMNYRPNLTARNLARKSSALISFVLGNRDFLHPFHSRVLQGVQEYCEEAGYFVMYAKFQYASDVEISPTRLPLALQMHGMTGCLVLAGTNHENLVKLLQARKMPYALLGNNYVAKKPHEPFNQVRFDDDAGASEATRHLIDLGHRHIWYIGDTSYPWFKRRYQAYLREIRRAGLKPHVQTLALSDDRFMNGLRSTQAILDQKMPVTAIFAGTDDIALGAWEALRRRGLDVPRDVSLVGFDDQQPLTPGRLLTSVRVEASQVGRELAKMALARSTSRGASVPETLLGTKLMKRETCRPLLETDKRFGAP